MYECPKCGAAMGVIRTDKPHRTRRCKNPKCRHREVTIEVSLSDWAALVLILNLLKK